MSSYAENVSIWWRHHVFEVLRQKSIDALNSYGQFLLDNDIRITIVLFITILQNWQKSIMLCHDRFMKIKDELIL